jgi:hypothetical protein
MAYTFKLFDNMEELVDYLNDVVSGKYLPPKTYGLHGLTLIVDDGSARTTTFVDATDAGLTPKDILDQIRLAHANMINVALRDYGHMAPPKPMLVVTKATYVVDKDGTANPMLGFSAAADSVVGVHAVAKANIISILRTEPGNKISLLHE